jgi:outer membrane receptor protein involved in Fe transport
MVEETNAEITSGLTFVREYEATGLELEGDYDFGNGFRINGNLTWIDAEIAKDATNASVVGNTPRRQADMIYTISPEYSFGNGLIGASVVGSSDFYLQDSNQLKQDAYQLVHVYANYQLSDALTVSLNVNNITDEFVITESEEGAAAAGDFVRARPLSGRSTSISVRYDF